jgi:hypothetical protein
LLNVSNPDTASDYWVMAFTVQNGLRITLSGSYPASRYMSFTVYNSHGNHSQPTVSPRSSLTTASRRTPAASTRGSTQPRLAAGSP